MLRRRRPPAARWTVPTPGRRRTWRYRQVSCEQTAPGPPLWGCAGRRSLRRIFPEGATPNHGGHARGGDRGQRSQSCEEPRPDQPLDDFVLHLRQPTSDRRSGAVEPCADRLDHEILGLLVLGVALWQQVEDPAREHLLDRAVERHRCELRRDRVLERALLLRLGHDLGDQLVGLADLRQVGLAERVRRARDLDDDHLHQLRIVAVGVDDERGDLVPLLARRDVLAVGLADRVQQDVPALEEDGVEHLVLGAEVVVDQAVRDARLVGDVGYAAAVEALSREDPDRGVEDDPALVRSGGHQPSSSGRAWRRAGSRSRTSASRSMSRSAITWVSLSGATARTSPHGSMIMLRPPDRLPGGCSPIWLGAMTKAWFSIARARSRTSQWSRVVASVNAAGTVRICAPASVRRRYSSGKRTS